MLVADNHEHTDMLTEAVQELCMEGRGRSDSDGEDDDDLIPHVERMQLDKPLFSAQSASPPSKSGNPFKPRSLTPPLTHRVTLPNLIPQNLSAAGFTPRTLPRVRSVAASEPTYPPGLHAMDAEHADMSRKRIEELRMEGRYYNSDSDSEDDNDLNPLNEPVFSVQSASPPSKRKNPFRLRPSSPCPPEPQDSLCLAQPQDQNS